MDTRATFNVTHDGVCDENSMAKERDLFLSHSVCVCACQILSLMYPVCQPACIASERARPSFEASSVNLSSKKARDFIKLRVIKR
jgi:predicted metal-binding protein